MGPSPPAGGALSRGSPWPALLLLLVVALAVRAVKAERLLCLCDDSWTYYRQARLIEEEGLLAGCEHFAFPPLPALCWAELNALGFDHIAALRLLSLAAGLGAVAALWFWVAGFAGRRVAFISALLLAVFPLHATISVDGGADAMFSLGIVLVFAALDRACRSHEPWHWFRAGLFLGLSYLVLPDALALVPAAVVLALFPWSTPTADAGRTPRAPSRRFGRVALALGSLLLGAALVGGPYAGILARQGHLLSAKIEILQPLLGGRAPSREPWPPPEMRAAPDDPAVRFPWRAPAPQRQRPDWSRALGIVAEDLTGPGFGGFGLLLGLAGLLVGVRAPRAPAWRRYHRMAPATLVLFATAFVAAAKIKGYLSGRHVLPAMLVMLPAAALFLDASGKALAARWGHSPRSAALARALPVLLALSAWLAIGWPLERAAKQGCAAAGAAIRRDFSNRRREPEALPPARPRLLLSRGLEPVALYADADARLYATDDAETMTDAELIANARFHGAHYVVRRLRAGEWRLGLARMAHPEALTPLGIFPENADPRTALLVFRAR